VKMRLLLFSDLHASTTLARRIVEKAQGCDVLIGAGDFGNVRRGYEAPLEVLRETPKPIVLVPGNNESHEELKIACADWPRAHVLHGSRVILEGVAIFGLGGGIPVTPFGAWSWDFTEEEAEVLLVALPRDAILVSHSPPKGAVDRASVGASLG